MIIAILPLAAAIIGLLIYLLSTQNPKAAEIGRLLMFAGMLVTLLVASSQHVKF